MDKDELVAIGLAAFDAVVASTPGFRSRPGQRQMATAIAEAFAAATLGESGETPERRIAVLQAGTGVGKSAAYLAVGIAIALARKTRLVVSSSTVTLQEQLTFKDLPQLRAVMPQPFSFALAKGRGRYVCRTKLLRKVGRSSDESLAFDDDDVPGAERRSAVPAPSQRIAFYRTLANALERDWEGDRDSLPESPAPEDWGPVAADRHTCTVRACPEFGRCSYYKARKQLAASDVLVVNHDLLLASIGTRMLPELDGALLVLDEGHNLPKTAAEQFASALDLSRLRWLDKFPTVLGTVAAALDEPGAPGASRMSAELKAALSDTARLVFDTLASNMRGKDGIVRFPAGVTPLVLTEPLRLILAHATCLQDLAQALVQTLRDRMKEEPDQNAKWSTLFAALGSYAPRIVSIRTTAELLLTEGEDARQYAKWISVNAGLHHVGVELHACPILPGELLNRELWPKVRAAAITSATLTSCGDFGYFLREAGLERDPAVTTMTVTSPFDYTQQGELVIQKTLAAPRALDDYNAEVSRLIVQAIPSSRAGALVLFTSRRHLEATVDLLSDELKERVLVQGMVGRGALLERHKARVNSGLPSIILGLQGFGEGLDLPGALLEDLYIAKLPFASPSGPLDEARAEYVEAEGGDAFNDLVVPATGLRLLQWVGRGVRTETDFARIVCFDSRLTDRAFGRKMLSGLPPYPIRQIAVRRETADLI